MTVLDFVAVNLVLHLCNFFFHLRDLSKFVTVTIILLV